MVLSSCFQSTERVHPVHAMNADTVPVIASKLHSPSPFILLLSLKADTYFTVPRMSLSFGWSHTHMIYLSFNSHPYTTVLLHFA